MIQRLGGQLFLHNMIGHKLFHVRTHRHTSCETDTQMSQQLFIKSICDHLLQQPNSLSNIKHKLLRWKHSSQILNTRLQETPNTPHMYSAPPTTAARHHCVHLLTCAKMFSIQYYIKLSAALDSPLKASSRGASMVRASEPVKWGVRPASTNNFAARATEDPSASSNRTLAEK